MCSDVDACIKECVLSFGDSVQCHVGRDRLTSPSPAYDPYRSQWLAKSPNRQEQVPHPPFAPVHRDSNRQEEETVQRLPDAVTGGVRRRARLVRMVVLLDGA